MENCWKVLGMEPTHDLDAIKLKYRNLLKTYHPDKVTDQDVKVAFTAKSVQINAAYKEAVRQAKTGDFNINAVEAEYDNVYYYDDSDPWYVSLFRFLKKLLIFIFAVWAIALVIIYLVITFKDRVMNFLFS